jgi:hypothetical protein
MVKGKNKKKKKKPKICHDIVVDSPVLVSSIKATNFYTFTLPMNTINISLVALDVIAYQPCCPFHFQLCK